MGRKTKPIHLPPKPIPLPRVRPEDDGMDSYMLLRDEKGQHRFTVVRHGTFQELKDLAGKTSRAINSYDALLLFAEQALNAGLCGLGKPLYVPYLCLSRDLDLAKNRRT
jgi:hypothetical protein